MQVKQFRYSQDNLAYLLYGKNEALAIDGGATKSIINFLNDNNLKLKYVTNTHSHFDHTTGNDILISETNAQFIDVNDLIEKKYLNLENEKISIIHTPGHTTDSICFHIDNILISGDTLFNGTIGNCFTGNASEFVDSLEKLTILSHDTIIYAGHDYIYESMGFAKKIDPNNEEIDKFLNAYNENNVCSLLKEELMINPFLRLDSNLIINLLKQNNLSVESRPKRLVSLKTLEIW